MVIYGFRVSFFFVMESEHEVSFFSLNLSIVQVGFSVPSEVIASFRTRY